jgi:four helix bundle protein
MQAAGCRRQAAEMLGHRDLKVFQVAYSLALEVFRETSLFPKHEVYSLTDQIRRALRGVTANLVEAHRKRRYRNAFVLKNHRCRC